MSEIASKIFLELSPIQVEKLTTKLPLQSKIRLLRKLEKETFKNRWGNILTDIDKRLKKFPISQKEINKEIKAYRKEKYAKSRS